jgi:hypothetical protein
MKAAYRAVRCELLGLAGAPSCFRVFSESLWVLQYKSVSQPSVTFRTVSVWARSELCVDIFGARLCWYYSGIGGKTGKTQFCGIRVNRWSTVGSSVRNEHSMRLNSCGVMYQTHRECYITGKCYKSVATLRLGNWCETKRFTDALCCMWEQQEYRQTSYRRMEGWLYNSTYS